MCKKNPTKTTIFNCFQFFQLQICACIKYFYLLCCYTSWFLPPHSCPGPLSAPVDFIKVLNSAGQTTASRAELLTSSLLLLLDSHTLIMYTNTLTAGHPVITHNPCCCCCVLVYFNTTFLFVFISFSLLCSPRLFLITQRRDG